MEALDAILALTCSENLNNEEEIKSWEVEKVAIDDDYYDFYTIETIDGKVIELTVMATVEE